jgi:hypothetical protein
MRENRFYLPTHLKHDDRNRGPGFAFALRTTASAGPSSAFSASLAVHEALVHHLGTMNQYYSNAFCLARPFYTFPFELMQQYFSFIFGAKHWVGEPVARQRAVQSRPQQWRGDGDSQRDLDGRSEEEEDAMDLAIGATREMWYEIVHEESTEREQQITHLPPKKRAREAEYSYAAMA